jgi:hypothetical protein
MPRPAPARSNRRHVSDRERVLGTGIMSNSPSSGVSRFYSSEKSDKKEIIILIEKELTQAGFIRN